MSKKAVGLGILGIALLLVLGGSSWGQQVVSLSDQTWRLWLDREATWQEDTLFLPPVNLSEVPVHEPTGGWDALYANPALRTTLPATVEEHFWGQNGNGYGVSGNYTGVSWFVTEIEIPEDWTDKRVVLDFESVRLRAEVFVNEILVGYDLVSGTPFTIDISKAITPGEIQRLAVRITDPHGNFTGEDDQTYRWGNYEVPPSPGFGGITGSVLLTVTDKTYIEDVFIKNLPALTTVDVEITLRNDEPLPTHGVLRYKIVSVGGKKTLAKGKEKITSLTGQQLLRKTLKCKWGKLWSPEDPQLYDLELTWEGKNKTEHTTRTRFGFRWFDIRDIEGDKQFYLNNKRVVCRSAVTRGLWPVNGLYPTPALARQQVASVKALGLNMLHSRGALASASVLAEADALGVLFCEEPGGYGPGPDSDFAQAFKREKLLRMVRRDRNHPSLVFYNLISGTARDPQGDEYRDMADAHKLDETRTLTFLSGDFPPSFYGECPREPAPVKLHMRPYDHEQYQQGWWDSHHLQGLGVTTDRLYQGPVDFHGMLDHPGEILLLGEAGGMGALGRLVRMQEAVVAGGRRGWDGSAILSQYETLDRFLTDKAFRDAFAGVDELCQSVGQVSHTYQGRMIENIRIGNLVDGYVVSSWEDRALIDHAGLVDRFRNPKTDPNLLTAYNQPLYVAVKCRNQVVAVDTDVIVDFYLVNEKNLRGDLALYITVQDDRGLYMEKTLPVTVAGGPTYGQLLVEHVTIPTRTPGYTSIKAVLRKGKKELALGSDRIMALAYDPNELANPVAVLDPDGEIQDLFKQAGIEAFHEHVSGRPESACLVVGGAIPPRFTQNLDRLQVPLLDWVTDGHTLVVLKGAGSWATYLADKGVVEYRGQQALGQAGVGGHYIVRQHPLFNGLPVNTAFNWEYQSLASHHDRNRFGLRLTGEQCVVACYAGDTQEMLTAVAVVPLGRGRIILSTLDLEAAIVSGERSAIVAKQILLNMLNYALTLE